MRIFFQRFLLEKLISVLSPRSAFITLFGILIGFLIGICLNYKNLSDSAKSLHFLDLQTDFTNIKINGEYIWIKCIILLQVSSDNPEKYLLAITETFGKKCNETIFLTSSQTLSKKFAESFNILLLKFPLETSSWMLFRRILSLIETNNQLEANNAKNFQKWTVVISEKNYLIVENLIHFLSKYSFKEDKTIIIGKIEEIK